MTFLCGGQTLNKGSCKRKVKNQGDKCPDHLGSSVKASKITKASKKPTKPKSPKSSGIVGKKVWVVTFEYSDGDTTVSNVTDSLTKAKKHAKMLVEENVKDFKEYGGDVEDVPVWKPYGDGFINDGEDKINIAEMIIQ